MSDRLGGFSSRSLRKPIFAVAIGLLASGASMPAPIGQSAASATDSKSAFDPLAASEAYMAKMSPEAKARSDSYFEGGYWLLLWDFLVGLSISWVLLQTKLASRMRDFAERRTHSRWLQTSIFAFIYILFVTVLALPWNLYEGFLREHQYGLSNQTLPEWLGDQFKGLAVGLVFGTVALTAIYTVIRRSPQRWWLWGAGVATAFLVVFIALAPVYVAPLFNTYKPLPETPLKAQILSLARANGIPASDVYWFDASKQSKRISANVSGIFNTIRISMNDNLMNRGSPEAIRAVLGHEMGHYVLNHIYKELLFFAVVIVIGFSFLRWGFGRAWTSFGERWGIRGVADTAGLPLLAALFLVFSFLITPVTNTVIRTAEAEADIFGLNASREPDGFAQAALQLSEYRKMRPGRLEEIIFFDHPSGWNRIYRSMVWKAEQANPRSPP